MHTPSVFPAILVLLSVLMIITIAAKATYKDKGFYRDIELRKRETENQHGLEETMQAYNYTQADIANWNYCLDTIGIPHQPISSGLYFYCASTTLTSLSGTIPTIIGQMSYLSFFDIQLCALSGTIPTELGNISISGVLLPGNNLSGTIPTELGNIGNAKLIDSVLDLSNNNLSGTIPTELGNISKLSVLSLSNNNLFGIIPTELGVGSIIDLELSNNNLSGIIPSELGLNQQLATLNLTNNALELPNFAWDISCSTIYQFFLSFNLITILPSKLILRTCPQAGNSKLELNHNKITAIDPIQGSSFNQIPTFNQLATLDLSYNLITGTLSVYFFLNLVQNVNLANNKLSGTLPYLLPYEKSARLQTIILSNNMFTGPVPIVTQSFLQTFIAANNNFDTISNAFFPASSFKMIDISSNNISNAIDQLAGFSDLSLRQFGFLSIANNKINGNLGATFFRNKTTIPLNLANNLIECVNLPLWCAGTSVWSSGTGQCYPCLSACGDGLRWDQEQCDDGNRNEGDGCSSFCDIEDNWSCYEPPVTYIDVILASPSRCSKNFPYAAVIAGTIVPVVVICCAIIVSTYIWRLFQAKNNFIAALEAKLQLKSSYLINAADLSFEETLGEGNFGTVYMGYLDNTTKIAIKELKNTKKGDAEFNNFIEEAKLVSSIPPHPNIVQFIGICISEQKQTIYIVIQYIANKNLHEYLATETLETKVTYARQLELCLGIAAGMHHLSKFGVVHNDLAARNILIEEIIIRKTGSTSTKELVPKVSDFGMAWNKTKKDTKVFLIPVRWTAPEVLLDITQSSTASDVWSYGIVMYEIFTKCTTIPYASLSTEQVIYRVTIEQLYHDQPIDCSDQIYDIMRSCWSFDPAIRPTFSSIFKTLKNIIIPKSTMRMFYPGELPVSNDYDIDPYISDQDNIYCPISTNRLYE